MTWYTYLVRCKDGSLYCGITNDLERRIIDHNRGAGSRYCMARRPVKLVWWQEHPDRSEASKCEYKIKKLTKLEKEKMVSDSGFKRSTRSSQP